MNFAKNKIAIIVCVAVVLIGAGLFWTGADAPKKTVGEIQKTIGNRDLATFEKYVDLESFFGEGFDSYLSAGIKWRKEQGAAADAAFLAMFKVPVVQELVFLTKQAVEKGGASDMGSMDTMGGVFEEFGVRAWELKRVGSSKKRGKTAIVPVTVRDRQVDKDFIFDIELAETDDGIWQIKKVANAEDLILKRLAAAEEKLSEINAGILKKIVDNVSVTNIKAETGKSAGRYSASYYLKTSFTVENKLDKGIKGINAAVAIPGEGDAMLFEKPNIWAFFSDKQGIGVLGQKNISVNIPLSKANYDMLNAQGIKDVELVINYIQYGDGEELRTLDGLPPYKKK